MNIFSTAFRNLLRHRTRSLLSLFTIAGAIASIILFRGYASDIMESLKKFGVESQFGHIQIAHQKLWDPETQRVKDKLFQLSPELSEGILNLKSAKSIAPRVTLQALLNHQESQFGAKLVGYDPQVEKMIFDSVRVFGGGGFVTGDEDEILLGVGLNRRLKVKDGQTVTIITQTVDGVVNAIDVVVRGTFATTVSEIDEQVAYVPIRLAQRLLDTDKIESAVIRLENMDNYKTPQQEIGALISRWQPDLAERSWRQLANLYNQVEEFYSIQNLIIQIILSVLTILAVMNTVGMTVLERTGEIGTLRALGLTKNQIVTQFLTEGFALGAIASLFGFILGSIAIFALNVAQFKVNIPGASVPIALRADYDWQSYLLAFFFGFGSTVIGTLLPAYRASRLAIVEALRRNI